MLHNMSACLEFLSTLQHESSQRFSTGIENVECAVRLPGRRRDAILDDATHNMIQWFAQTRWQSVL